MTWLFGEPLARLLWKEWRIARSFGIALAVFGVALLLLSQAMGYSSVSGMSFVARARLIVPMIPLMAIVGIVATGFAAERENNTLTFHRSLPTTIWQTMFSKLFVGLVIAFGLSVLMVIVATTMHGRSIRGLTLASNLLPVVELVAWGTWISLLTRRPLVALVVASSLAVGIAFGYSWLLGDGRESILARWITALVVGSAAVASGPAWFDDRSGERWGQLGFGKTSSALASRSDQTRQGRISQMFRLVWCQIKADAWFWAAMLSLLAVSVVMMHQPGFGFEAGTLLHVLLFALIGGIASAKTDTEKRFLSSQAISPTFVWLSNLAIPISLALLVMALNTALILLHQIRTELGALSLASSFGIPVFRRGIPLDLSLMLFTGSLTSAVVGQWMARSARSKITAFGTSIATGVVVLMWLGMATVLLVPWWYSALPAILGSLLATWITCRAWLYGWQDQSAKRVAIGAFLATACAVFGAFGWFRATEFPRPSISENSELLALPETNQESVERFRSITAKVRRKLDQPSELSISSAVLAEQIADDLESDSLAFPVDSYTQDDVMALNQMRFEVLKGIYEVVQAKELERTKRLIQSHFLLTRFIDQSGFATNGTGGFRSGFSASAIRWAWMPEVTPEDIREVIDLAESNLLSSETIRRCIAVQSDGHRRLAQGDWSVLGDPSNLDEWAAGEAFNFQLSRILPWERIRLKRFLGAYAAMSFLSLDRYEETLQSRKRPDLEQYWPYLPELLGNPRLLASEYLLRLPHEHAMLQAMRVRRAQIVCLALVLYSKTHDNKLPDDIRELEEIISEETLIDPLHGQPFILVNPASLAEWVAQHQKSETYDWRDDPLQVYRQYFLWSPNIVVERDPDTPSEEPRFWITKDRTGPTYPIGMILDDEVQLRHREPIYMTSEMVWSVLEPLE